ncbi:RHS domain-containing protein [Escherichia coli]|nr:RHS domain-containing protein [Escherichia coli]
MLALMDADGNIAWSGEYDEWGNQLNEENPASPAPAVPAAGAAV